MRNLDANEISSLLGSALVAHVAVVDGDLPYVGPMSFIYADGLIGFRTRDGRRLEAIRNNPAVSIDITETGPGVADWTSVIVTGTAEVIDGTPAAATMMTRLIAKYRATYGASPPDWLLDDASHLVAVTPTKITGRASTGTRPGRFETTDS